VVFARHDDGDSNEDRRSFRRGSTQREYWIAADEVMWDYAPPFPINLMSGEEFTDDQKVFVEEGIGRTYLKSVYQEYTPGFGAPKERGEEEKANLGLLGPIIRAEVGDTIVVHFRNNTRFPASIHPHGVFYTKSSEGAIYNDGTEASEKADDIVYPGTSYTYFWRVPERAGPSRNDPSSIIWAYHSHVHTTADTNAGLIGTIIITRKGMARADGSPKDVDREFVTLFNIYDENVSNYLSVNNNGYDPDDEDFQESNLMHGMNGHEVIKKMNCIIEVPIILMSSDYLPIDSCYAKNLGVNAVMSKAIDDYGFCELIKYCLENKVYDSKVF